MANYTPFSTPDWLGLVWPATVSVTSDSSGAWWTYNPQVYTQETLAKRPHCAWCGQRMPFDAYDCPFCGGYQDG